MSVWRQRLRAVALCVGYLGVAHFVFGIWLTVRFMAGSAPASYWLVFISPYVGITVIYATSVVYGHRKKLRQSVVALVLALLVSASACAYDMKNHRYQLGGTGRGHIYTIWWWYYEPYWKDYTPGNL